MEDAKTCEQWMERQMQLLSAHYDRADYSIEEGEKLLRELEVGRISKNFDRFFDRFF